MHLGNHFDFYINLLWQQVSRISYLESLVTKLLYILPTSTGIVELIRVFTFLRHFFLFAQFYLIP